jgi:hypothetical protein
MTMQKREITWIAVLLVLGVGYYHFFGGRYAPKPLMVHASLRPARRGEAAVFPVYFTLDDDVKLTSIKVVPLNDDGQVDPATVPSWNLVADGTPTPIRAFFYGQNIQGMKPALTNVQTDALTPGVIYQMTLSAGKQTATLNFKTEPTR